MIGDLFADAVRRSVAQDLSVADLLAAADQLSRAGEQALLLQLYSIWIKYNASSPLLHAVYFNYGVALTDAKSLEEAKAAFLEAIRINPGFAPPYINLGSVCERLGALDQAVAHWTQAVNALGTVTADAITYRTTALKQIGRVFETARLEANAESVLQQSLEIDPHQRDVIQHWIALRQAQCKWPVIAPFGRATRNRLLHGISPLSLAAYSDDPLFQLANAHHYNKHDVVKPAQPRAWPAGERSRHRRLRIGYVSSDLREHAVGFLTAEVFELHDRQEIECFVYYSGIRTNDAMQARIKAGTEHWTDITDLSDEAAAQKIMSDGIDILVDLNGYSKDARLSLFAMRPAPIIVNWLGYPGTMGSGYHNYIIADPTIIPAEHEVYYTEKVLRLPCYQPTDRKRVVAEAPSRRDMGLPEEAVVFCCFNGMQKLTRATFEQWMTILREVEGSVLWLLTSSQETNERLRQAAEQQGVARDRLIFADKRANAQHLARYPLADLFLDTFPYGAHTTASDAMWMGVPVVTRAGHGFASRVCASLVSSAGLPELVCATTEDYVAQAIELGRDRERLHDLRHRLRDARNHSVLFDTPTLVRRLEALYQQMWDELAAGRLPRPDLSHLETYHEIASEDGHEDAIGQLAAPEYQAFYRDRLLARGATTAARHDSRLNPRSSSSEREPGLDTTAAANSNVSASHGANEKLLARA
jgi:predicted O-linked N-acetylglucosamine transferase (SPINDLY family)